MIVTLLNSISKHDDEQSFEKLYHIYHSRLYATCSSIIHNREIVEEILVDVFHKLWRIRKRYHEIKNLDTYLYVSTKNLSYDYLRRNSRWISVELNNDQTPGRAIPPDQIYMIHELKGQIDEAIEKLPNRCRQVFVLIRIEGLSYKKAAEKLKISPKTVENQLAIAVKKLVKELKGYLSSVK